LPLPLPFLVVIPAGDLLLLSPLRLAFLAVIPAGDLLLLSPLRLAFLVVIPAGDLLLPLPLPFLVVIPAGDLLWSSHPRISAPSPIRTLRHRTGAASIAQFAMGGMHTHSTSHLFCLCTCVVLPLP
jgi:hypothetical protein